MNNVGNAANVSLYLCSGARNMSLARWSGRETHDKSQQNIDLINVETKIKKNVKRGENKKNVCKRWIKNFADICHESN